MAKIGQQPKPPQAQWPWGGPKEVRGKLVDRAQIERKNVKKKGDPKNPSLPSAALMDSIGPAHSADELRLPMPPGPLGHDADVESFLDRPHLSNVAERANENHKQNLDRGLTLLRAAPERVDRLKALLQREGQMLELVGHVSQEMAEIERMRRQEQIEEGV
jgi:hypothetical protein